MSTVKTIGTNIWLNSTVIFGEQVTVGHGSCVGYGNDTSTVTRIGNQVQIGAFCVIHIGAIIEDQAEVDHYCRVGSGSVIGQKTKLLYGVQIFDEVKIGQNCIIGGDLADRVIVEDNVTYMGEIAHSHRNPNLDWDSTEEPSPTIKYGSVVGVNSLIIGGVSIGPQAYIAAGEVVRHDIPPRTVLYKGKMSSIDDWRGVIRVRD